MEKSTLIKAISLKLLEDIEESTITDIMIDYNLFIEGVYTKEEKIAIICESVLSTCRSSFEITDILNDYNINIDKELNK